MKNIIYVNIDTERVKPILFYKPPEFKVPSNREEAGEMILQDIIGLANALKELIIMASENGYSNSKELVDASVKTINEANNKISNNETNGYQE